LSKLFFGCGLEQYLMFLVRIKKCWLRSALKSENFSRPTPPPPGNLVVEIWDARMRRGYRDEPAVKMDAEEEKSWSRN
jgi:hypothetical protein